MQHTPEHLQIHRKQCTDIYIYNIYIKQAHAVRDAVVWEHWVVEVYRHLIQRVEAAAAAAASTAAPAVALSAAAAAAAFTAAAAAAVTAAAAAVSAAPLGLRLKSLIQILLPTFRLRLWRLQLRALSLAAAAAAAASAAACGPCAGQLLS